MIPVENSNEDVYKPKLPESTKTSRPQENWPADGLFHLCGSLLSTPYRHETCPYYISTISCSSSSFYRLAPASLSSFFILFVALLFYVRKFPSTAYEWRGCVCFGSKYIGNGPSRGGKEMAVAGSASCGGFVQWRQPESIPRTGSMSSPSMTLSVSHVAFPNGSKISRKFSKVLKHYTIWTAGIQMHGNTYSINLNRLLQSFSKDLTQAQIMQ